jgi:hypothetical protein
MPDFRLWEQEAGSSNLPTPTTSTGLELAVVKSEVADRVRVCGRIELCAGGESKDLFLVF